jgi:hypothetical protein
LYFVSLGVYTLYNDRKLSVSFVRFRAASSLIQMGLDFTIQICSDHYTWIVDRKFGGATGGWLGTKVMIAWY